MPETLSIWAGWAAIVAVLLAIVTIMLTVWLFRRGQKKRAIGCELQEVKFPIEIRAGEALKGDIEILYKGEPIDNLFLVRARLKNTGNQAIRKEHIVKPVTFAFSSEVKHIREPRIVFKKPNNLSVNYSYAGQSHPSRSVWAESIDSAQAPHLIPNNFMLDLDLLNPDDEFGIEFVCTGKSDLPKVAA